MSLFSTLSVSASGMNAQRTRAELLAEKKALRKAECDNLEAMFCNGAIACGSLHRCQPEIARVQDVCEAYKDCIGPAKLPPMPIDCAPISKCILPTPK